MRNFLIIATVVLLASCSSNPITPKIETELRNQLTKEKLFHQLDSTTNLCYEELLDLRIGFSKEFVEDMRLNDNVNYNRIIDGLQPNYNAINDSIKHVLTDYLSHWNWTFVTNKLLSKDMVHPSCILRYYNGMFGPNVTQKDLIMHYIYYNLVPKPKLHLDEKMEDDYYKVTDLKTAKQYILEIKDDSLYSYKVLK